MNVQHVAPTPRKKINAKEAARLFLLHNGICCNCGQQISVGAKEPWFIEHVEALVLGGAEGTDDNRRPAHVKCKAAKDASDAAARSERDRHITAGWQPPEAERSKRKSSFKTNRNGPFKMKMDGTIVPRKQNSHA